MDSNNDVDLRKQNIDVLLSGDIERSIQIAFESIPKDTFTILSREQFFKLVDLGVDIPLKSQTKILDQVDSCFLDAYAALARYTPPQIRQNDGGKYAIAEEIMQTTWSFWFDYLCKLKKEMTARDEHEFGLAARVNDSRGIVDNQQVMEDAAAGQDSSNTEQQREDHWDGSFSKEALALVDDVWAEFVKAGMDE